jgi:hypothetical protein
MLWTRALNRTHSITDGQGSFVSYGLCRRSRFLLEPFDAMSRHVKKNLVYLLAWVMVTLVCLPDASAVPSFSRKYGTSCQTCHTNFPVLNPFGEAFRRNGYSFPMATGGVDSDAAKEEPLELGLPESSEAFPDSVMPSKISPTIPFSVMVNVSLPWALPDSDLRKSRGNAFTWDGLAAPISIYGAGSFSEHISYFSKVVISTAGANVGPTYLLFNDLLGPRHLLNLWIGRLVAPQFTSYSANGSYLADKTFPTVSIAGLYNPNGSFIVGQGPNNGVEVNGIALHRLAYSAGWLSSKAQSGLNAPTAEDFYLRMGAKLGGMSLDGEAASDINAVNPAKPWAETSLTLDIFAYHALTVVDNYTNSPTATPQRSAADTIGCALRGHLESLSANLLLQRQRHFRPYPGSDPTPANPPDQPNVLPGVPDNTHGSGTILSGELAYVVFPWLVPAVNAEYVHLDSGWGSAHFARFMPGVSGLVRPNLRFYVVCDLQSAIQTPPQAPGYIGSWASADSSLILPTATTHRTSVESITAHLLWAY